MKRLLGITLVLLVSSPAIAANYAQFAIGGGYESLIYVTNKTGFPWAGTVWIHRGMNQPWQTAWNVNGQRLTGFTSFNFNLNAHESAKFRITGDATTRAGYCEIEGNSSSYDSDVAVSYFYEYRVNGVLQDSIGDSESAWGDEFLVAVERSSLINTGFAWCPSSRYSTSTFPMVLTLYDATGAVHRTRNYTFSGHEAQFLHEIFPGLATDFRGHLLIECQGYMYLAVLRMEYTPTGFQFTSTPADDYIR